uniref:Glucosylceramidase n=1 Tax=Globodera rostochiensis TaxID=31243 RepID=A0A914IFM8_GLORO
MDKLSNLIYYFVFLFIFVVASGATSMFDCAERRFPGSESFVCVCNRTFCDLPIGPHRLSKNDDTAIVYMSDPAKYRLHQRKVPITLEAIDVEENRRKEKRRIVAANDEDGLLEIRVDATKKFQTVLGFGGAFTDAAGYNLNTLSSSTRATLLRAYFDKHIGIRYTLGRVVMGACDFSVREYSYCDTPDDFELKTFALPKEDLEWKIPHILAANSLSDGKLRLFSSPWSAPGWMKTNGRMVGASPIKGALDGPFYRAFANYFRRFFEEYKSRGINFWGLTLTNEPLHGANPGMDLNSTIQRRWANEVLAPVLKHSEASKNLTIMAHDDNRHLVLDAAKEIFSDYRTPNAIDGLAFHWYSPPEFSYDMLSEFHRQYPNKFLLSTEACTGAAERAEEKGPSMGNWTRALMYGHDIIEDMRSWSVGWVDWNICLDMQGGPNWVNNFVDAPIIINATADEFYKQPMFYALAHFSRFIPPNSVRIDAELEYGQSSNPKSVEFVAFRTPDNNRTVLVLISTANRTSKVKIRDGKRTIPVTIPPLGIATVEFYGTFVKCVSEIAYVRVVNNSPEACANLNPGFDYFKSVGKHIANEINKNFLCPEEPLPRAVVDQLLMLSFTFAMRIIISNNYNIYYWQIETLLSAYKILSTSNDDTNGVFPFQISQSAPFETLQASEFTTQQITRHTSEPNQYTENFKFLLKLSDHSLTTFEVYKLLETILIEVKGMDNESNVRALGEQPPELLKGPSICLIGNGTDFIQTMRMLASTEQLEIVRKQKISYSANAKLFKLLFSLAFRLSLQIERSELTRKYLKAFEFAYNCVNNDRTEKHSFFQFKTNISHKMVEINLPNWKVPNYMQNRIINELRRQALVQENFNFLSFIVDYPLTLYELLKIAKKIGEIELLEKDDKKLGEIELLKKDDNKLGEMKKNHEMLLNSSESKMFFEMLKYLKQSQEPIQKIKINSNEFCVLAFFVEDLLAELTTENKIPNVESIEVAIGQFILTKQQFCTENSIENDGNFDENLVNLSKAINIDVSLRDELQQIVPEIVEEIKQMLQNDNWNYYHLNYIKIVEWDLLEFNLHKIGKDQKWLEIKQLRDESQKAFSDWYSNNNAENKLNFEETMKNLIQILEEI